MNDDLALKALHCRIGALYGMLIIQFILGGELNIWKLIIDLILIEAFVIWCCRRR